MRNLIKMITIFVLALSMLLTACSSTPQATQSAITSEPEVPTEAAITEAPTDSSTDEPITLTWVILEFWNPDNVIAAYQKEHPNVTIKAEKIGFGDLFQQNQIRLGAGDDSLDIVSVDAPLVASYGARGWLYPLDSTFSAEEMDTWVSGAVEAGTYNEQFLAAPQHTSTQLLFYNKDMLEAAGITPPGEDERWTWEQVAANAQQLTHDDVYGFTWEQTTAAYQLLPLPLSLGGKAMGPDGFAVDGVVNSEEWVNAFTFYGDAFNSLGYAPKSDTPVNEMFKNGKLAMFVGGSWNNLVFSWGPPEFNWGVSRFPYFEGGETVLPTGSWHFGVNANSAHPEAAAEFVRWLSAGEGADIWWGADSYDMPAQKRIIESFSTLPEFQTPPLYYMQVAAREATVNPVPRPVTPGYLEYEQLLNAAFNDIRNGADPKQALDTAVQRITQEMAKYQK
ncbi:MAG: ABC transporter substrate-binding protein [Chloroflexota bacterium]|jgi:multiple sugar transport system substrate-binding protein